MLAEERVSAAKRSDWGTRSTRPGTPTAAGHHEPLSRAVGSKAYAPRAGHGRPLIACSLDSSATWFADGTAEAARSPERPAPHSSHSAWQRRRKARVTAGAAARSVPRTAGRLAGRRPQPPDALERSASVVTALKAEGDPVAERPAPLLLDPVAAAASAFALYCHDTASDSRRSARPASRSSRVAIRPTPEGRSHAWQFGKPSRSARCRR